jgi:hypothetical protein
VLPLSAIVGDDDLESKSYYLGSRITLLTLKGFILDHALGTEAEIHMHSGDFDEMVLEHRHTYQEGIAGPFVFVGVRIQEDPGRRTQQGRIVVRKRRTTSAENLASGE